MRYVTKFLVMLVCLLPMAAYGFASAEDVRIAKNGSTSSEVESSMKAKGQAPVSTSSPSNAEFEALRGRIDKLEKAQKGLYAKIDGKVKAAVEEKGGAIEENLGAEFADYTAKANTLIEEKFQKQDGKINAATADANAAKVSAARSAASAENSTTAAEAARSKVSSIYWLLLTTAIILTIGVAICLVFGNMHVKNQDLHRRPGAP